MLYTSGTLIDTTELDRTSLYCPSFSISFIISGNAFSFFNKITQRTDLHFRFGTSKSCCWLCCYSLSEHHFSVPIHNTNSEYHFRIPLLSTISVCHFRFPSQNTASEYHISMPFSKYHFRKPRHTTFAEYHFKITSQHSVSEHNFRIRFQNSSDVSPSAVTVFDTKAKISLSRVPLSWTFQDSLKC